MRLLDKALGWDGRGWDSVRGAGVWDRGEAFKKNFG